MEIPHNIAIHLGRHQNPLGHTTNSLRPGDGSVSTETKNMNELEAKIKGWLEKEGYPLEMRVAHAFEQAGFKVEMSSYYRDPEENKYREIDIVATKVGWADKEQKIFFEVRYECECKHSNDKPWILFQGTTDSHESLRSEIACKHASYAGHIALLALSIDDATKSNGLVRLLDYPGNGLTRALGAQCDTAYKAVMSAAKAASSLAGRTDEQYNKYSIRFIQHYYPLVVTTGRLFRCQLSKDLAGVSLDEIRERSLRLNNPAIGDDSSIIEVVTEAGLRDFLSRRSHWASELLAHIETGMPSLKKFLAKKTTGVIES